MVRLDSLGFDATYLGDIWLNSTRIICAMILHINIMPEVRCSLEMLRFCKNNPEAFHGHIIYPYLICIMQMIGGLQTELSNLFLMVES